MGRFFFSIFLFFFLGAPADAAEPDTDFSWEAIKKQRTEYLIQLEGLQGKGDLKGFIDILEKIRQPVPADPIPKWEAKEGRYLRLWVSSLKEVYRLAGGFKVSSDRKGAQNAVKQLGVELTSSIANVVMLTDYPEFIEAFFQWSISVVHRQTILRHTELIKKTHLPFEILLAWLDRIDIPFGIARMRGQGDVQTMLEHLESIACVQLVRQMDKLGEREILKIVERCRSTHVLLRVLNSLEKMALNRPSVETASKIIDLASRLAVGLLVKDFEDPANDDPFLSTQITPGRIVIDSVMNVLRSGQSLPADRVPGIFKSLHPLNHAYLSAEMETCFFNRSIPDSQIDFIFQLSQALSDAEKASEAGGKSSGPSPGLGRLVQKAALQRLNRKISFEGTYEIWTRGQPGHLTIALSPGERDLILVGRAFRLSFGWGPAFAYADGDFQPASSAFFAGRFGAETMAGLNSTEDSPDIQFTIYSSRDEKTGELFVEPTRGVPILHPDRKEPCLFIRGKADRKKDNVIPPDEFYGYQMVKLDPPVDYQKELKVDSVTKVVLVGECWSGKQCAVKLTLKDRSASGQIIYPYPTPVKTALPVGFLDKKKRYLVSSSGELENGQVTQIRGQFTEDQKMFHGYQMVSGWGWKKILMRVESWQTVEAGAK